MGENRNVESNAEPEPGELVTRADVNLTRSSGLRGRHGPVSVCSVTGRGGQGTATACKIGGGHEGTGEGRPEEAYSGRGNGCVRSLGGWVAPQGTSGRAGPGYPFGISRETVQLG